MDFRRGSLGRRFTLAVALTAIITMVIQPLPSVVAAFAHAAHGSLPNPIVIRRFFARFLVYFLCPGLHPAAPFLRRRRGTLLSSLLEDLGDHDALDGQACRSRAGTPLLEFFGRIERLNHYDILAADPQARGLSRGTKGLVLIDEIRP
jgi:hypothetical protein